AKVEIQEKHEVAKAIKQEKDKAAKAEIEENDDIAETEREENDDVAETEREENDKGTNAEIQEKDKTSRQQQAVEAWAKNQGEIFGVIPSSRDSKGDDIDKSLEEKSASQCKIFMEEIASQIVQSVDLKGGTVSDWWDEHIRKGTQKGLFYTDLTTEQLKERAVEGLLATVSNPLREAIEAEDNKAQDRCKLANHLNNVFNAPPMNGVDPRKWVCGAMHEFGSCNGHLIMSVNRMYLLGCYSKEEIEAALGRDLPDHEVEEMGIEGKVEDELQILARWAKVQVEGVRSIPRKDKCKGDEIHESLEGQNVSQCMMFMQQASCRIAQVTDLENGTMVDWWIKHIGKGELETDLTPDELEERALAGLLETVPSNLRVAIIEGQDEAVQERESLVTLIKNVFGAPKIEGVDPRLWVCGEMHEFSTCNGHIVMSVNRKYQLGTYSKGEFEAALGRGLSDDMFESEEVDEEDGE
ncbi:unnamed protein product, partial [Discosporangium mesarthrocarpum]